MFGVKSLNLTNQRPAGTTEAIVSTTTNKGGFKLNANASRMLGLMPGDYACVSEGEDNELYIYKGWEGNGFKVAPVGGKDSNSGSLTGSAANVYAMLGGSKDAKKEFVISEDVVNTMSDDQVDSLVKENPKKDFEKFRGVKFYKLTFKDEVAKTARKKSEKATA